MKKTALFLFVVSVLSIFSYAAKAGPKLNHKMYKLLPEGNGMISLSYSYTFKSAFKEAPGEKLSYHVGNFESLIPIPINDRFLFGVGLKFRLQHFRLQNIAGYFPNGGKSLYVLGLPLDGMFFIGDRWFVDLNFTPTLSTDFKSLSSRDVQYNGAGMAGVALSDVTAFYFGVGIGRDFLQYFPFPILGLIYRPTDSFFSIEAMLPAYVRFEFDVSKPATIFVQGDFYGNTWDIQGSGTIPDHFFKFIDTRAGAGVRFKLMKGLFLSLYGGVNPWREAKLRDNTGAELTRKLKIGFFGETMFSITPELFGL